MRTSHVQLGCCALRLGRSDGGAHDMATAIADLEAIRKQLGLDSWVVLGHSWGSDLAVRYALERPERVTGIIGIAGRGVQYDRLWSAQYERLQHTESDIDIKFVPEVHEALKESFLRWIHEPQLFRALADSVVPMQFIAAGNDIRPSWPLQQLAELVPRGSFETVPHVAHNFWATDPDIWLDVTTRACAQVGSRVAQAKG